MTAETIAGAIGRIAKYRTCQYTGLEVDIAAQSLIKANAVAAMVFLAVGGLMDLLVALTRWPAVHLLPAEWLYLVLTGHGANVLLFWIIFFEMAVLYFASAIGSRAISRRTTRGSTTRSARITERPQPSPR